MENTNGTHNSKELQQAYRTAYLIAGFIKRTLSQEEKEELDDWIVAKEDNMRLFGELTEEKNIAASLAAFEKMNVEEDLKATKKHLQFTPPRKFIRSWQYAIAASVIVAVSIYITQFSGKKNNEIIAVQTTDINPGSNTATLTLENGQIIQLDPEANDTSFNGQVRIMQQAGEILYENKGYAENIVYHTLTVPRKGQYRLTLPDGTKVWLNAESSIKYPVAFSSTERKVFVTGETFFEVAPDKTKPFRVTGGEMTVEALGTKFNINVYPNEPFMATTLAEGSVLVSKGLHENILQPGQQAQIKDGNFLIASMDAAAVTAWRNNEFKFHNTPMEVIMRQVERWYDAEVIYKDKIDVHLNATIDRNVPVSRLLQILEATGHVHFEIEGKKITVHK